MAKFNPSPFGIRIRQSRAALGLSQIDLAAVAKVSQTTISSLESGRRRDTGASDVFAMADALHVDARWLVTGKNASVSATDVAVTPSDRPMDINSAACEISLAVAALKSIHAITRNQQVGIPIDPQDFYVLIVDLVVRTGMRLEVAHNAIGEGLIGEFEYPIDGAKVPHEVIYG